MNNQRYSYNENEISFTELFKSLKSNSKFIFVVSSGFALFSIIYSLTLPNLFTSHSILNFSSSSQSSSSQNYSGVASLAGIRLSGGKADKADEMIELIKSRGFLEHLISFDHVLPSIMIPKVKKDGAVDFSSRSYNSNEKTWRKGTKPTALEAHEIYIRDLLKIWRDKDTGFINIQITHISPKFSYELLSLVISQSNEIMRLRDLEDASNSLSFLTKEIQNTSIIEMRNSISSLLQSQLETKMVANIREDYILRTIEPPFIPEKKSAPSRLIFVVLTSIIGFSMALLFVFFRDFVFTRTE